jgi:hypothetical protein
MRRFRSRRRRPHLGLEERELDVEIGGERRVRHHAAHEAIDRLGLELELVGEILAVRLDELGAFQHLPVLGADVREVGHDGPEGVVAELHDLTL